MLRVHLKQNQPTADGFAFAAEIDAISNSMAVIGFGPDGPYVVHSGYR
jgi:hypothetical protein